MPTNEMLIQINPHLRLHHAAEELLHVGVLAVRQKVGLQHVQTAWVTFSTLECTNQQCLTQCIHSSTSMYHRQAARQSSDLPDL